MTQEESLRDILNFILANPFDVHLIEEKAKLAMKLIDDNEQPIPQDINKWIEEFGEKSIREVYTVNGHRALWEEMAYCLYQLLLPELQQLREETFSLKARLGALASLIQAQCQKWEGLEKVADPEIWMKMYNHYQELLMNHDLEIHGNVRPYTTAHQLSEKDLEIEQQKAQIDELKQENERLMALRKTEEEMANDPYWYWPQCDVEGCEGVSCNGGGCWQETGYWLVCPDHSKMWREGKPQPKMKQSAIDKEATRDPITGYLPSPNFKP